jgi:hypothetical protein
METRTLKEKNNILSLARELYKAWEITLEQLNETYYHNFIK